MSKISITNLYKNFGETQVLRGIDLEIPQGSVMSLLGPSGCGKTTLLRMIAGFDYVDQGSISFDENVVASVNKFIPPEKRGIGYVPQEGTLFPHLTVEGNVRFGIPRKNDWQPRVQQVLELTGLQDFGKRFPHELSGGQQQRVALARALAPDPGLILLDEPFNALDLDLRRSICEDVIQVLRHTSTTAILVSHDPGEAFAVSDNLAVMLSGEIMQYATPQQVYWQPNNAEVARLTGDVIFVDGKVADGVASTVLGNIPTYDNVPANISRCLVMIRPEQIQWSGDSQGITGQVIRRSFRGDHTIVEISLGNMCLDLRMPSLTAPAMDAKGAIKVVGNCMAYSF